MKLDLTLGAIEHQRFHTVYHTLQKKLHRTSKFKEKEIERFLITYYKFTLPAGKKSRQMTHSQFSTFYQIFLGVSELEWIDSIIAYVEPGSKKFISAEAYLKAMELWTFGSFEDKKQFCFTVYDRHRKGYITKEVLRKCCRNMVYGQTVEDTQEMTREYADFLLRKFDKDRDGRISFDDYSQTVNESPHLLEFLGQLCPDLTRLFETFQD